MKKDKKWFRIGDYECPTNVMSTDCHYLGQNNVISKKDVNIFYNPMNNRFRKRDFVRTFHKTEVLRKLKG